MGRRGALAGLIATWWAAPAAACPYCDSDLGRRVSAGIFNADFWSHAGLTLLPLAVLLVAVAAIHFGPPWGRCPQAPSDGSPAARENRNPEGDADDE